MAGVDSVEGADPFAEGRARHAGADEHRWLFDGAPKPYQLGLASSTASAGGIVEPRYQRPR